MDLFKFDVKKFWEENDFCWLNFDKKIRIFIYFWFDDYFLFELVGFFLIVEYYFDKLYRF